MAPHIVVPVPGGGRKKLGFNNILNPSELINGCEAIKNIHDWKRSGVNQSYHSKTPNRVIDRVI